MSLQIEEMTQRNPYFIYLVANEKSVMINEGSIWRLFQHRDQVIAQLFTSFAAKLLFPARTLMHGKGRQAHMSGPLGWACFLASRPSSP